VTFHLIDRTAVEEEGQGASVICVHGLGGSSNTFTPLMAALSRQHVVRIDLPGSGRSQKIESALSIERFVDAVLSVCARLNVQRAHFVGHSMGTIVCQHLAAAQPKLVQSLSLFGPLIAPPDAARTALMARAAKARSEGVAGMHDIAQTLVRGALSAHTREHQPLVVAFVRESLMRQGSENYALTCEVLAKVQPAAVEKIQAPVLLVTGDEDAVAPPQSVRSMAEKFYTTRSSRVVVLPRCGHWTTLERPVECQRELGEFLASQEVR
jgi:3-oxoadipate enol-lactonase